MANAGTLRLCGRGVFSAEEPDLRLPSRSVNTELVLFGPGRAGVIDTSAPGDPEVGRLDLPGERALSGPSDPDSIPRCRSA